MELMLAGQIFPHLREEMSDTIYSAQSWLKNPAEAAY
jgi:hypothetical protein